MLMPGSSALSFKSGVRTANSRMFSRAAATSSRVGNLKAEEGMLSRCLKVDDLSHACRARLLQHIVRGGKILGRDAEGLVQGNVGGRAPTDLGAVRHLA